MVYWWIGEGFVPPIKREECTNKQLWDKFNLPSDEIFTSEHWANHYFKVLLDMGFIESAQTKPNPKVDICKMHPFVRSIVNRIAQDAAFFEFDYDGSVNQEFQKSLRACLLNGNTLRYSYKPVNNIHAMLNVDEEVLDFRQDLFPKMRNVNVLYLGRWQSSGTHHIEIDDTGSLNAGDILDGLQNIKYLKFLSLQGISRIFELPKSVLKLQNLTILDVRACHNLQKIPVGIVSLVNLTHLDMSECPLLNEIPKQISLLTKLQVLRGFVVLESKNKNSCTLAHLKDLHDLRKLSIQTSLENFPSVKDLRALNRFKFLSKLSIAWRRGSSNVPRVTLNMENKKKDNDEANSSKEKNWRKEYEGESTKEQDIGHHDNDQTWKKDYREGKREGNALQIREEKGNSQEAAITDGESRQHDKGKGILEEEARDIVKICDLSIQESLTSTSRQIIFLPDVSEKYLKKNNNTRKKADLAVFSSRYFGLLGRGVKRLPSMGSKSKKSVPFEIAELPSQLTKLDLQCSPGITLDWLRPKKLPNLEKLYIRGGKLSDLGQYQDFYDVSGKWKWNKVKELRLKYLYELEMDWRELLELFPGLDYLEKVDCPKLSFFPCDETGVWTKKKISHVSF